MVILVNCSYKGEKSNSNYFLEKLEEKLTVPYEHIHLQKLQDINWCKSMLAQADAMVLGMPLYVDGMPAQVMEFMEKLYEEEKKDIGDTKVYVVSNLGFYESIQIHIQLDIVKNWCEKMGITYGGGLAIGAGEMLGGLRELPMDKGPNRMLGEALIRVADGIDRNRIFDNIFVQPAGLPRWLYMFGGNMTWAPQAKKNGVRRKEIRRRR